MVTGKREVLCMKATWAVSTHSPYCFAENAALFWFLVKIFKTGSENM